MWAFVIMLVTIAASASTAYPKRGGLHDNVVKTYEKDFLFTTNRVYFATAKKLCREVGYESLAYIESHNDYAQIRSLLNGTNLNKLWVGGTLNDNEECVERQTFKESCWIWGNIKTDTIEPTLWHEHAYQQNRTQSPEARTIYRVGSGKLDFEADTRLNQVICQRRKGFKSKQFYYSSNMATYDEALEHCNLTGYSSLAHVEYLRDVAGIKKILDGAMVAKLWVGGGPVLNNHCMESQSFHPSCWVWDENADNPISRFLWHSRVSERQQSANDRTVFISISQHLDFEASTNLNQFICERPL